MIHSTVEQMLTNRILRMNTQVNLGKTKFRWPIIENSSHKKKLIKSKNFSPNSMRKIMTVNIWT